MIDFKAKFEAALPYDQFLAAHASDEHRRRWAEVEQTIGLTEAQRELLAGFVREMNVLCLAGTWCGDCIRQCPIQRHFERANPKINLRFVDRDADPELRDELRVCGGMRVPVLVFLSEEFAECGRYGDRPLSYYRQLAEQQLGAACPTGLGASSQDQTAWISDWLAEFERIQLMLRLSPRLRERHGD
jgi:ferredoxin